MAGLKALIDRFQAAKAKADALALELATELGLQAGAAVMGTPPARTIGDAPRARTHKVKIRPKGQQLRDIAIRLAKEHGEVSADMLGKEGDTSGPSAGSVLSRMALDGYLQRVGVGRYKLRPNPLAFPAALKRALKASAPIKAKLPAKPKQKGPPAKAPPGEILKQVMALAHRRGGTVDIAAAKAAGIGASRRAGASKALSNATKRGHLVRIGPETYATPEYAAALKAGKKKPAEATKKPDANSQVTIPGTS